jgi:hypothetical protein
MADLKAAPTTTPTPSTPLVQREREALEAWLRWGTRFDPQLLDQAIAKVPVQLALDRQ